MARVISAKGAAALIIADSVIAGRALRAEELTADLARNAGLVLVARASQKRPHFHLATQSAFRGAPRREHVILVRKA